MKFFTRYNVPPSPSVDFVDDPGLTDQSQKDDCDINRIMARYRETGYLVDPVHPGTSEPLFGDFTDLPDYQAALDLINRADDAFMHLPAKVREKFGNNPQEIFDFLADEKNRDEAISLGLIEKPKENEVLNDSDKESLETLPQT